MHQTERHGQVQKNHISSLEFKHWKHQREGEDMSLSFGLTANGRPVSPVSILEFWYRNQACLMAVIWERQA